MYFPAFFQCLVPLASLSHGAPMGIKASGCWHLGSSGAALLWALPLGSQPGSMVSGAQDDITRKCSSHQDDTGLYLISLHQRMSGFIRNQDFFPIAATGCWTRVSVSFKTNRTFPHAENQTRAQPCLHRDRSTVCQR